MIGVYESDRNISDILILFALKDVYPIFLACFQYMVFNKDIRIRHNDLIGYKDSIFVNNQQKIKFTDI